MNLYCGWTFWKEKTSIKDTNNFANKTSASETFTFDSSTQHYANVVMDTTCLGLVPQNYSPYFIVMNKIQMTPNFPCCHFYYWVLNLCIQTVVGTVPSIVVIGRWCLRVALHARPLVRAYFLNRARVACCLPKQRPRRKYKQRKPLFGQQWPSIVSVLPKC